MHIRILKPLETKKEEENHRKEGEIAAPHPNHEKTMTSLSYSRQKSEGEDQQCSVIRNDTQRSKSETNQLVHVYQYTTNIYTESRKEQREIKFKRPGSANCQHSDDVISDGINHGGELYPSGCNISSGYKYIRKWINYELAKTHMYSWARCCGMPGM